MLGCFEEHRNIRLYSLNLKDSLILQHGQRLWKQSGCLVIRVAIWERPVCLKQLKREQLTSKDSILILLKGVGTLSKHTCCLLI